MNKSKLLIITASAAAVITAVTLIFFTGRKNAEAEIPAMPENVDVFAMENPDNPLRPLVNYAAINAAFTLDYRPLKAEPENEPDILSVSSNTGTGSGSGIVGGGLKNLSDYQTVYFDPVREREVIEAVRIAQTAGNSGQIQSFNNEPLTVIDWGPRGDYSSAIQRPSVYVIFSQPMTALASLGEASSTSPLVTISPAIKGTFRWYGTSFLSFEGEEPCQSQQTYTITVAANAVSMYGNAITGETVFSFNTEVLLIKSVTPGEEFRKNNNIRFDNNNVPPEAAKQISLEFNYPVTAADINRYLEITSNNIQQGFNLRQENEYKIIAELLSPVDFESEVKITLKQGAGSRNATRGTETDQTYSFRTPDSFKVNNHYRQTGYGRYRNLLNIYFSHALNVSTVMNAIRLDPAMNISGENIEIYGSTLTVYNLPIGYGDKFTVYISQNVEDIYGRRLSEPWSAEIVVPDEPPPVGDVRFLDYRSQVMLEAQFPPRYLFEYKNIANSWYTLRSNPNPWNSYMSNASSFSVPRGEVNSKYFEEIDLSPYLNAQGKGIVSFTASIELLTNEWQRDGTYRSGTRMVNNSYNIQVTDLGMTVRYGFNKAVVLVTSLSTGKPIENANVKLLPTSIVFDGVDLSVIENYGEAVTDSGGLAVIELEPSVLRNNTVNRTNWQGFSEPVIFAEKDGDRAVFYPTSHNSGFGVYAALPQRAEEIVPSAFLFSDRGLYQPGEIITFRGVDRSRVLGMYTIYNGDYTVTLEENTYRPAQIRTVYGSNTESGSFFDSIDIPEDMLPGSYRLVYRRGESPDDAIIASIPVTIAFFERLKFEAVLSAPPAAVIMGDDVNLNLRASYLSGGSLSGASWEGAWYEEMTWFRPNRAETRGYTFGPQSGWYGKRYVASQNGMLSAQGTAGLSQKTGGSKVTGAPYIYQAEARVTDISNQMVTAFRSVVVHPAGFYIGLNRAVNGFSRAGQNISFNYLTVNTEGEKTSNNALFLQVGEGAGQIKAELIREEWRRVQQMGVNGYIYDEYSRQEIVDSVQNINIQNGGGVINVKPSAAGYHILRVTGKDREGRTALTEYGFYVTGSGGYWNMNNPNEIRLTPDQDMYEPGDTANILLQSTLPEGYYLITVEREGIFTEEVRYFSEPVTVIEIPIARNYVPVVYVAVASYSVRSGPPAHEYGSPDLDKPKGYFGVTRIRVNPRTRAFSIQVETDKKTYRPGEEVTVTLTATRDGTPLPNAELSLMAVDRGVLDLINYHVPDPVSYFYSESNFQLSVRGGDSRAWLMDPVTYSVKNLAGGDAEGDESKIEERKDFNPTAVFEPMLITDSNGKVTHTFKLPDNLTTYRVTVFGVRGDLFALKESEIAAQNIVNVREVLPRRIRERDTAEAGVLITNLDSIAHTMTVKLDIGAPLASGASDGLSKIAGQAFVDGTAERRVTVGSGENIVVYFDVAGVREGNVTLNFTVNSDVLNERLIREMIIEKPYVMETVTTTGTVDRDTVTEGLVIPSFADNGAGSLTVSLDATRLSLLDSAVTWLFRYPYGCLEQRSSLIVPLVIFGEYIDALSLKSEVANPRRVVETELIYWAQLQLSNGGFPYWPSGTRADFYVSLRIAHVIAIAKEKNINIPSSFNENALLEYLNREYQDMQRWQYNSASYYYQSYLQSYMLYVFALLGERVDPARLAEILSRSNVDPSVLAFTGMTYRLIGRNAEAESTAQRLRNLIRMTVRGADITDPLGGWRNMFYGSRTEQLALTLQFFVDQYPGDEINTRLLFSLLEEKRSGASYWENTAVTARVLSAVDALIKAENLVNLDVTGSVMLAGTQLLQGAFTGLGAKPVTRTFDFNDSVMANILRDRTQTLAFSRNGDFNVYYTASLRYAIPSELQSFRDEGLGVYMTVYDIETGREISGTALNSGKTYRAAVRVSSTRDRTYLALRIPVPSGAEILDAAFVTTASYADLGGVSGGEQNRSNSWISHQVILDNEIQYFWDRFNRGETTVYFLFRAARRGVYPTPPVQAECMYEPEIFGRSGGLLYTIE